MLKFEWPDMGILGGLIKLLVVDGWRISFAADKSRVVVEIQHSAGAETSLSIEDIVGMFELATGSKAERKELAGELRAVFGKL